MFERIRDLRHNIRPRQVGRVALGAGLAAAIVGVGIVTEEHNPAPPPLPETYIPYTPPTTPHEDITRATKIVVNAKDLAKDACVAAKEGEFRTKTDPHFKSPVVIKSAPGPTGYVIYQKVGPRSVVMTTFNSRAGANMTLEDCQPDGLFAELPNEDAANRLIGGFTPQDTKAVGVRISNRIDNSNAREWDLTSFDYSSPSSIQSPFGSLLYTVVTPHVDAPNQYLPPNQEYPFTPFQAQAGREFIHFAREILDAEPVAIQEAIAKADTAHVH